MVDIRKSIEAKSDRLNADDLIGNPMTVRIEAVRAGNAESPVAVFYEGCHEKPWYPSKTMRRALVAAWGDVAADWVGKSVTLYRDPDVIYGGIKVGGIRISAFSDIENDFTLMLAEKRGKKSEFKFKKLSGSAPVSAPKPQEPAKTEDPMKRLPAAIASVEGVQNLESLEKMTNSPKFRAYVASLPSGEAIKLTGTVEKMRRSFDVATPVEENTNDDF